jgi:hypothetical protein
LLEKPVRAVTLGFGSEASRIRLAEWLDKISESGPDILSAYKLDCFVLSEVSGDGVVMLVLEYMEAEVVDVRNVDSFVES